MSALSQFHPKNPYHEVFQLILAFLTLFVHFCPLDDFPAIFVASRQAPVIPISIIMCIRCVEVTKMLVWQVTGPHSDTRARSYNLRQFMARP